MSSSIFGKIEVVLHFLKKWGRPSAGGGGWCTLCGLLGLYVEMQANLLLSREVVGGGWVGGGKQN